MEQTLVGDARDIAELGEEYSIVGELGRGGSAIVYRARDRSLGREVAIKVVHPRPLSSDDDPVARLAREARTVAQLQHPHVVTVYAVRRLRGGGLALVMQLVPGRTLKTVVQQEGPLSPERCERILRDVADALAYAHARGIVHRDVKPENIFLDDESGRALLSDFGIARSGEGDSLTMTGTAIGTPFYMSPEQVEGGALDGRSDLYSLGLVAWEMLTGRRPWDGESLYNVIYKQKHAELAPIEALRPGVVPHRLQYVVERMLQKRPAARWAGADGLLVQLGRSVLPADYAKWQAALRARVERWQAAEQERVARERVARAAEARPQPVQPAQGAGETVRFTRPTSAPAGAPATEGAGVGRPEIRGSDADLADTMSFAHASTGAIPLPAAVPATHPAAAPIDEDDLEAIVARAEPAPAMRVEYLDEAEPTWATEGLLPAERPRRRLALVGSAVGMAALGVTAWVAFGGGGDGTRQSDPGAGVQRAAMGTPALAVAAPATGGAVASDDGAGGVRAGSAVVRPAGHVADVVATGGRHSCVVTFGASVQCWGANERGQLGDGTLAGRGAVGRVLGDLSFVQVSAGLAHSCAVTRMGDVYCWGNDARGQLGDATTVRRNAPVRVAGDGRYVAVRAGGAHSCGLTTAGIVACWGANDRGQLGDGSRTGRTVPVRVHLPEGVVVRAVATGNAHACALDDEGRLYCWGANAAGQLGDGSRVERPTPVPTAGALRFAAIAAGGAHSCGVTADGTVHCWGANESGQLGTGDRTPRSTPASTVLPAGARIAQLALGAAHSCALASSGEAWCWGRNATGQLGDGTVETRPAPVRVREATRLSSLSAAVSHSCGVTSGGQVLCWGSNSDGQIGDSTRVTRRTPTPTALPTAESPALVSLR
jgi:alpha-tubulin suppressor-like RCC1 family protein